MRSMKGPQLKRMSIVIAVCASVGAIAGIAGSAAAPSKSSKATQAQKQAAARKALKRAFRAGPGPLAFRGPVHATAVVPNEDGTGFDTITTDAGTLKSVDGTTVHIKEGTDKATYKDDVAVDVGSDAKVFRNHEEAKLSDLKEGDHVRVITGGPKGNIVIAESEDFLAKEKERWRDFKRNFRGRHGFGLGPGGPPPPGAPGNQNGDYPGSESGGTNS
jgi:Cu/Ag efflux protein CusF